MSPPLSARISQETVAALYAAKLFLPGPKENVFRRLLFYLKLILPLVDFLTDWINAGTGYILRIFVV